MFCPKCGQQIPDDSRFCPKCGNATMAQAVPPPPQPLAYQQPVYQQPVYQQPVYTAPATERTSGMAIAALIMGLLGISLLAIIFGGVGISQCNKDPYLKGKGMAIAGLILGILQTAFWIIMVIMWVAVGTGFWWVW
jgi:hypothetical protein